MSPEFLTYKSSGVDVGINNRANEAIKNHVKGSYNRRVLTKPGLFSGALSLKDFQRFGQPVLVGSLGRTGHHRLAPSILPALTEEIIGHCLSSLPPPAEPVAFLDYAASAALDPLQVEGLVKHLAGILTQAAGSAGRSAADRSQDLEFGIPILGGETAEMPGTFRRDAWEAVGALWGIAEGGSDYPHADLTSIKQLAEPALLLSMDGLGTKASLGFQLGRTGGLAQDLVHHSLNDILCQGARGIAVLVYLGCHTGEERLIEPFRQALTECGRREGMAVLDLMVTEKPQAYRPGEYDLCAAVAGLVDAGRLLQGLGVRVGDRLIGLPSSGLHTNGYSLARRALLDPGGLRLEQYREELGAGLGETLLTPHKNYAPLLWPLLQEESARWIRGIAHITGGGLADNLSRILPPGLGAEINKSNWTPPPIFTLIQRCGKIPDHHPLEGGMYDTFNMGIGLVLIADRQGTEAVMERLEASGGHPRVIGAVMEQTGSERIRFKP